MACIFTTSITLFANRQMISPDDAVKIGLVTDILWKDTPVVRLTPTDQDKNLEIVEFESFKRTNAFKSFRNILLQGIHRGDIPIEKKIENWRVNWGIRKNDVGELLFQIINESLTSDQIDQTSKKERPEEREICSRSVLCTRFYPVDEKRTKMLLQKVISVSRYDATTALFSYLFLYPNCIFDDDFIQHLIQNSTTKSSLRLVLCRHIIQEFKNEKKQSRQQLLIDKAYEWAFCDANLEQFYLLDRFLLNNKKQYINLPQRLSQLKKFLLMLKNNNVIETNWVYRRTVVSISIFDKGEEAQTILRDLDENAKYKIIEK